MLWILTASKLSCSGDCLEGLFRFVSLREREREREQGTDRGSTLRTSVTAT